MRGAPRCEEHAAQSRCRYEDARPSRHARGYGPEWDRLRRRILQQHPWCMWPGCPELATDVDHIVPKARGGTDDWDNLQALCHRHHSIKTRCETRGK